MTDEKQQPIEETREPLKDLEENPPEKLEDWPDDERKYETFGGREGDHSYAEGPEQNLGPSDLRHHEDGSVSIEGEKVDNPEDYKGEPIPGGPTDPNSPALEGDRASAEEPESSEKSG